MWYDAKFAGVVKVVVLHTMHCGYCTLLFCVLHITASVTFIMVPFAVNMFVFYAPYSFVG